MYHRQLKPQASGTTGFHWNRGTDPPFFYSNPPPSTSSITKQPVPEIYPQVLALPIARRPLFPGFYKAAVVRNPAVIISVFAAAGRGEDDKEDGLIAVLYPSSNKNSANSSSFKLQGWSNEDHRRPTANGGTSYTPQVPY
ncbi:hypothetical protein BYT27DRAFT_7213242 [Phlegmacium glaucopus]|nr:hypothetical protein BYT27DRAFT_7213242 [Phlegmacium glaucopus]